MQSNNPVFSRSEAFNGQANAYGNQTHAGNGSPYAGYGDPATWGTGTPGSPTTQAPPVTDSRMTIDSVVQASAISLVVVVVARDGDVGADTRDHRRHGVGRTSPALRRDDRRQSGRLRPVAGQLVQAHRQPGPGAGLLPRRGRRAGRLSKFFDAQFGDHIVINAVLGTFGAFAGTLAAYKFFNIKVGAKFRTFVIAAMFGMVGLSLLELVLSMFGNGTGLFGVTGLGMITAFAGLALGIFMLILDFDMVEKGIAAGVDERESWRAAFALTVSLVWIYTNLLRILAFFQSD